MEDDFIETHAVRSAGGAYVSSQRGSVSGRSRASSSIVHPVASPGGDEAVALSDSPLARSASLTDLNDADDAEKPQRRRRVPLAGFSKVLQDATRVAEALGKAQKARKEREERAMEIIKDEEAEKARQQPPSRDVSAAGSAGAGLAEVDVPHATAANVADEFEDLPCDADADAAALPSPETVAEDAFEDIEEEEPFISSAEITEMCEERVHALSHEDKQAANGFTQQLFIIGITVDDAKGRWSAADGRIGYYSPPGTASPHHAPVKQIAPIDDNTYQRLLGKHYDDDAAKAAQRDALRSECLWSRASSPPALKKSGEDAWNKAMRAGSPAKRMHSASPCKQGAPPLPPALHDTTMTSGSTAHDGFDDADDAAFHDDTFGDDIGDDALLTQFTAGERLYFKGAAREHMKQQKLQNEREAKVMEEMATISKGPVITRKAAAVKGDFIERQEQWAKKISNQRNEALQRREVEEERAGKENRRVHLSKKSQELGRRPGASKGPIQDWETRFARHRQAKTPVQTDTTMFKPKITASAARINRGNAAERLHNDAIQRVARQEARVIEQAERDMYDPNTGHLRYTPSGEPAPGQQGANPPSPPGHKRGTILFTKAPRTDTATERERGHRQDTVVNRLLAQGQAAERKIAKKKSEISAEEGHVAPAKLSRATQQILTRIERRPLYETSSSKGERGGVKHGSVLFTKGGGGGGGPSCASSCADSDTRTVCSAVSGGEEFAQRSIMKEKQRQMRLDSMRKNKENAEMQDCTFMPSICNTSKTIFKKCTDRERSAELWGDTSTNEYDDEYEYDERHHEQHEGTHGHQHVEDDAPHEYSAFNAFSNLADSVPADMDFRYEEVEMELEQEASYSLESFQQYMTPSDERTDTQEASCIDSASHTQSLEGEQGRVLDDVDDDDDAILNKKTFYTYPSPATQDAHISSALPSRSSTVASLAYAQSAQSAVQNWRRLSQQITEDSDE